MQLVNETQQVVTYQISTSSGSLHDQGTIEVNGVVDMPAYDNQTNVSVQFFPEAGGDISNRDWRHQLRRTGGDGGRGRIAWQQPKATLQKETGI